MKTLLIVLLTAALLAAACFTRPDEQNFRDHLARSAAPGRPGSSRDATDFRKAMAEMEADAFASTCDFQDRLLWVDVQRDGKTIYTGAFAHWFKYPSDGSKASVTSSTASKAAVAKPPAARRPFKKRPVTAGR